MSPGNSPTPRGSHQSCRGVGPASPGDGIAGQRGALTACLAAVELLHAPLARAGVNELDRYLQRIDATGRIAWQAGFPAGPMG